MDIITTPTCHTYNQDEENFEGSYRIEAMLKDSSVQTIDTTPLIDECIRWAERTHSEDYVRKVQTICKQGGIHAEIELKPSDYDAIVNSAALAIEAADKKLFALTRPPGHHAGLESYEGFCFLNNIAIATNYLVAKGEKVFILDFDVHHGNGTQDIFYDRDDVFFASVHQEGTYPYSGFRQEAGAGKGLGFTLNVPLQKGAGDHEFTEAIEFILTKLTAYNPSVIAVSAGFDAYKKDRLGGLQVSLDCYKRIGKMIRSLNTPTFALLEGGYHSDIQDCIHSFLEGFK